MDGAAVVCPAGDGQSYIRVYVRNASNSPVVGAEVYFGYDHASCNYRDCSSPSVTGADGIALLYPRMGIEATTTDCCEFGIEVFAHLEGEPEVALSWNGAPGPDIRDWKSLDLDNNLIVNGVTYEWGDMGIFSGDFQTSACRSDFSGDGQVNIMDLSIISPHVIHLALVVSAPTLDFTAPPEDIWHCQTVTLENWGNNPVNWQLTEECPWLTMSVGGNISSTLSGTIPGPPQEPPHPDASVVCEFCVNTIGLTEGYHEYDVPLTSSSSYHQCVTPDWIRIGVTVEIDPTAVEDLRLLTLEQNFPNPFNPKTAIGFTLAQPGRVDLIVYDIAGRLVKTLSAGPMVAGRHEVLWDGRDESGNEAASGVYYYRLETDGTVYSKGMVLLR
jgi:hypothetical protein